MSEMTELTANNRLNMGMIVIAVLLSSLTTGVSVGGITYGLTAYSYERKLAESADKLKQTLETVNYLANERAKERQYALVEFYRGEYVTCMFVNVKLIGVTLEAAQHDCNAFVGWTITRGWEEEAPYNGFDPVLPEPTK